MVSIGVGFFDKILRIKTNPVVDSSSSASLAKSLDFLADEYNNDGGVQRHDPRYLMTQARKTNQFLSPES